MAEKSKGATLTAASILLRREDADVILISHSLSPSQRQSTQDSSTLTLISDGYHRSNFFHGMLARDFKVENIDAWGVELRKLNWRTVDAATGEVLANVIDYQVGSQADPRFWVQRSTCFVRPPAVVGERSPVLLPVDKLHLYDQILQGGKR